MPPSKNVFILKAMVAAVPLTFALAPTYAVANLHPEHEITEEESQKLSEVLAGAPRFEFSDSDKPVDESQTCRPPMLGDSGDCAPTIAAKSELKAPPPVQAKNTPPKDLDPIETDKRL